MHDTHDIIRRIASDRCSRCGGPAPGWKCPGCALTAERFDPMHWRNCEAGAKMQAQCEHCGEAESRCTCSV